MTPWEQVEGTPEASSVHWDSWEAKSTERYTLWILPEDTFLLP